MKVNLASETVEKVIADVERRCSVRCFGTAGNLRRDVEAFEKRFPFRQVAKTHWIGTRVLICAWCECFPGSYRGKPETTCVDLLRTSTGWFVVGIDRVSANMSTKNRIQVMLSEEHAAALLTAAEKPEAV